MYSDRDHYSDEHRRFLNDIAKSYWNTATHEERRERYGTHVDRFEMVDVPDQADIYVLTMKWPHYVDNNLVDLALRALDTARRARKPFVMFSVGDSPANFPVSGNDIHVFESSGYQSRRRTRVHGMPPFFDDPLDAACGGTVRVRDKQTKAQIGFCGQAGSSLPRHAARAMRVQLRKAQWRLGRVQWEPTPLEHTWFRQRVLETFERSPAVETHYVLRTKYRAGIATSENRNSLAEQSRREFFENVLENDYTLCMRGGGNFSVRFYEALALGRIPIFIDTDCLVPYHDRVDWQRYIPWIDARDLADAPQVVADFHARLSPAEFRELQLACRQLWVERLSPDGFYAHFAEHFEARS
ncbi:MAG: glycosyltransferase family 47 protein [Myxococcota bacterium]|nr:glycosyltransferase family 47 protein [Myxococcota bacterium]